MDRIDRASLPDRALADEVFLYAAHLNDALRAATAAGLVVDAHAEEIDGQVRVQVSVARFFEVAPTPAAK